MINKLALKAVFENSLKLKPNESCLIITDTIEEEIAKYFFDYAYKISPNSHIEVMEPLNEHGQEPPKKISDLMLKYDVELLITNKSLTHTKARRDATSKGVRIASMPMVTEDIINRCLDIDYENLRKKSIQLKNILFKAKKIKIITDLGTNIIFEIGNREIDIDDGILDSKCAFGNLPAGEVDFSPINSNGIYIVDASFPTFGKLNSPLTFYVSNGLVTKIIGKNSKELISNLNKIGKNAYIIAELGIGINPKAKIIGNVLEDEKVLGTCHIAIGNNVFYGGSNDVPIHLDGVITKPTIYVDGKKVMEKGLHLF